ncbi:MAG: MoaD/ThiS family protein [Deltaproteobacteria bacterium]|nr:MoaD/ThiS family protein [Deltaproteobacteria bacterium]
MASVKVNYLGVLSPIVGKENEYIEIEEFSTLRDLITVLGLRYGERFSCSLEHADGTLIWADVAIVVDGLPVHDAMFRLAGKKEVQIALIPMIQGG